VHPWRNHPSGLSSPLSRSTPVQVYALADGVGPRYRALILLACFCGLRWGELAGLQRIDIDAERRTVRVVRQLCEVPGQPLFFAPPKSDAGKRLVVIPPMILTDVLSHLDKFTSPRPDALLFTSPTGKLLRHPNFRRTVWLPARAASGLDVHFHDLRHTGNQLVAEEGANLRELMERMGHSTSRAALIYQHSTSDRQHRLADAVAARVQAELGQAGKNAP
jgi:integrase